MGSTNRQEKSADILRARGRLQSDRLKRASFKNDVTSCASDSKWRRIFDSLQSQRQAQISHANDVSRIKLLRSDQPFEYRNLLASCFEETYFDGMSGPILFREIEWLEIESNGNTPTFDCEVDFELHDGTVRIYGYRTR